MLEDPEIHCLSGRPCSGTYSAAGIPQGVGACPANTGCALLPGNEAIMGCVPAGRGDVAYVNADGSLTRGGKLVSGPAGASSAPTATAKTTADTTSGVDGKKADSITSTTTTTTTTNDVNSSGSKAPSSASATVKPGNTDGSKADTPATAIGSQGAGALNATEDATKTTEAPTSAPVATLKATSTLAPEPTSAVVTSQQTLADIDGETKTSQGEKSATGVGITSIIGIVVGCLAVVAVVAGVRLLKKDKEAVVDTPEGGMLDDYGGGITPKENVVLL